MKSLECLEVDFTQNPDVYMGYVNFSAEISDAAVRFGPVQRTLGLNLGPDLRFGSSRLLNLGLDLEGPVQQVRFG